MTNVAT